MPECLGSKHKRFGAGVRLAGLLFLFRQKFVHWKCYVSGRSSSIGNVSF